MIHRAPHALADGIVTGAVIVGLFGIVLLAVAGGLGVQLPAWVAAACGLGGGAVGWAINTPRRP